MTLLPNKKYITRDGNVVTTFDRFSTANGHPIIKTDNGWYFSAGKFAGRWETQEDNPDFTYHIIFPNDTNTCLFLED